VPSYFFCCCLLLLCRRSSWSVAGDNDTAGTIHLSSLMWMALWPQQTGGMPGACILPASKAAVLALLGASVLTAVIPLASMCWVCSLKWNIHTAAMQIHQTSDTRLFYTTDLDWSINGFPRNPVADVTIHWLSNKCRHTWLYSEPGVYPILYILHLLAWCVLIHCQQLSIWKHTVRWNRYC
jgi:hypothetical protein